MNTDGSRHRIVDEFLGQTINTSQNLLIPFSPIAHSARQVETSSPIFRTYTAGVR